MRAYTHMRPLLFLELDTETKMNHDTMRKCCAIIYTSYTKSQWGVPQVSPKHKIPNKILWRALHHCNFIKNWARIAHLVFSSSETATFMASAFTHWRAAIYLMAARFGTWHVLHSVQLWVTVARDDETWTKSDEMLPHFYLVCCQCFRS